MVEHQYLLLLYYSYDSGRGSFDLHDSDAQFYIDIEVFLHLPYRIEINIALDKYQTTEFSNNISNYQA